MISLSTLPMKDLSRFDWIAHFEANNDHRLQIDFSKEPKLTSPEKNLISPLHPNLPEGRSLRRPVPSSLCQTLC